VRSLIVILALVAVVTCTASATYSSVCKFSWASTYYQHGQTYCKTSSQVNHHIVTVCPCRVQGSISASGPFQSSYSGTIQWGNGLAMNEVTQSAPTALVMDYDLELACGETYKVEMSCQIEPRPPAVYWIDQGSCDASCVEEEPGTPPHGE
jgi:hypothetical protein